MLFRRGSVWYYEFTHRGTRYRASTHTKNKIEAKAIEVDVRRELERRTAAGASSMSLGEAVERYYVEVLRPKRPKKGTAAKSFSVLKIILEHFGDVSLSALTQQEVNRWTTAMLKEKLSPATANRRLAVLKAVLRRAYFVWQVLPQVPRVDLVPLQKSVERFLTDAEYERLLGCCPPHLYFLVSFLANTGARLSEATGLRWREVDLVNKSVRFADTKAGKPRNVPLADCIAKLLIEEKEKIAPSEDDAVFTWEDEGGNRKPFEYPKSSWLKARDRAGLPSLRLHDLRHYFAASLVRRGVSLFTVQRLLGHSSPTMTQRYLSLRDDDLAAAVRVLD